MKWENSQLIINILIDIKNLSRMVQKYSGGT
jgi:hypothetical protein